MYQYLLKNKFGLRVFNFENWKWVGKEAGLSSFNLHLSKLIDLCVHSFLTPNAYYSFEWKQTSIGLCVFWLEHEDEAIEFINSDTGCRIAKI